MSGREDERPGEVIERGPVTLRRWQLDRVEIVHDELNVASGGLPRRLGFTEVEHRPLDEPSPGGSGVGVVWRLTR